MVANGTHTRARHDGSISLDVRGFSGGAVTAEDQEGEDCRGGGAEPIGCRRAVVVVDVLVVIPVFVLGALSRPQDKAFVALGALPWTSQRE